MMETAFSLKPTSDGGDVKLFAGNITPLPPASIAVRPEKVLEVAQKNINTSTSFPCHLCDKHLIDVITQELLSGLATACVDSTRGNPFKGPATVANDIRKAMLKYLGTRSQYFVAESIFLEDAPEAEELDDPYDIISGFLDDFAHLNRNLFSMVPGWLLSQKRMTRIDDFMQELKEKNFWELEMREAVAQVLLMNVDFMNLYHCTMTFGSEEELVKHQKECGFRPVMCGNEGCMDTFSAEHLDSHDLMCPFKVVPCEQGCAAQLVRHDMDTHCDTICPMQAAAAATAAGADHLGEEDVSLVESHVTAGGETVNRLYNNTSLMDPVSPPALADQPVVASYPPPSPDQTAAAAAAGFPANLATEAPQQVDHAGLAVFPPPEQSVAVLPPPDEEYGTASTATTQPQPLVVTPVPPEQATASTTTQPQQLVVTPLVPPEQATASTTTQPQQLVATPLVQPEQATASTTQPPDPSKISSQAEQPPAASQPKKSSS